MKHMLLIGVLALPLAGCASYQGGADESYSTSTGRAESQPEPAASPTFRPGMNRNDPRDPQFVAPFAQPEPVEPPPSTTF